MEGMAACMHHQSRLNGRDEGVHWPVKAPPGSHSHPFQPFIRSCPPDLSQFEHLGQSTTLVPHKPDLKRSFATIEMMLLIQRCGKKPVCLLSMTCLSKPICMQSHWPRACSPC